MTYTPVVHAEITDPWFGTSGPRDARIVLVGESWGAAEADQRLPFVGESGKELTRMLEEAGFPRNQIFLTNCFAAQPPGNDAWRFFEPRGDNRWRGLNPTPWVKSELNRLYHQLKEIQPTLVIAAGNYALWALTESLVSFSSESTGDGATVLVPTGIMSWRGSMLLSNTLDANGNKPLKVLPILHPAAILRAWYLRAVTIHDLSTRIPLALSNDWRPSPPPNIIHLPTFREADRVLGNWLITLASGTVLRLSHDIETARGTITCMAFADGGYAPGSTALVLPLVRPKGGRGFDSYWSAEEEFALVRLARMILSHPNVRIEGQNYNYDTQWIERDWGIRPALDFDTMLAHHLLWPGTPKGLDYLASLYNHYYWYWKDDNKEWEIRADGWEAHLRYNAEDTLRTYECATELRSLISAQGFDQLWTTEKAKNQMALEMMRRGVRIDARRRAEMAFHLQHERQRIESWLGRIIPQDFLTGSEWQPKNSKRSWYNSPTQQRSLFYKILGFPSKRSRKTGNETLDAEALEKLKKDVPWAIRIWDALELHRSVGVFKSTFIEAELEPDGRMKCSFNTAGTETFRWSSSSNAFWRGTNLQNIPKGEEPE
jgi:uracil-DNA glycosylase family 4